MRFGDAIAILLIVVDQRRPRLLPGAARRGGARRAREDADAQRARAARRRGDHVVAASAVVAGDVLELEAGDAVPADARLLQTIDLSAEESSLTGESVPVAKDARAAVADDAPLGDRATMLFVGTSVVRGKGRAVVVATGARTELGHAIGELIHRPRDRTTPLEEKLDAFGKRDPLGVPGALGGPLRPRHACAGDRSWHELLLEAVSLAVAAIPEGLPAITTITLALGMQRMAKRGAIIRKLAAVETLGAATIICSDKTGTLTQNEMTVREVYAGRRALHGDRRGLRPGRRGARRVERGRGVAGPASAAGPLRRPARHRALCNNATLQHDADGQRGACVGDPTEGALLDARGEGRRARARRSPARTRSSRSCPSTATASA